MLSGDEKPDCVRSSLPVPRQNSDPSRASSLWSRETCLVCAQLQTRALKIIDFVTYDRFQGIYCAALDFGCTLILSRCTLAWVKTCLACCEEVTSITVASSVKSSGLTFFLPNADDPTINTTTTAGTVFFNNIPPPIHSDYRQLHVRGLALSLMSLHGKVAL